jgi:CelD/BcsL family acetyltransferase involved in cellulose biosynthesis
MLASATPLEPISMEAVRLDVQLLTSERLASHLDVWSDLAADALTPNVFYEPWMLLPALAGADADRLRFLLVFGPAAGSGPRPLWGFFPLELQSSCLRLPIRTLAFWQHRYCYLTLPLLHRDHAPATLEAFWRWFEHNPLHCRILDTNWLLADGPFHAAWTEFTLGRTAVLLNDFPRALFQPAGSVPAYLGRLVSRKGQNEFQRRERRLAELGRLEYTTPQTPAEAALWADDFLRLETMGWKGTEEEGKAFGRDSADAAYFRDVTRTGFEHHRVLPLSLTLDGRPIAMRHTLLAGCGSYAFRTGYDEHYAKYSPGLLLELETMRRIAAHPEVHWMDSCAAPRHPLLTRIWRERRMIRRSLFSAGSISADLLVSALPLLRWIGKFLRPRAIPDYLQVSTKLTSTEAKSR